MLPALKNLGNAEVGRLILAALEYDISDKQPTDLIGKEAILWPMLMSQIDRNKAHYKKICETNRDNVTKRYDRIRSSTTVYDGIQENRIEENRTEKKKTDQKREVKRFAPPTLEEVRAYCQERMNTVDPERFVDYYTSNGWKVGKNPMKDWKAAVRSWERSDSATQKSAKSSDSLDDQYEMMRRWAIETE
jgi:hypothetical protein